MYDRIRELRIKKDMSQQELAKLTGYRDRSSIAKIETGAVDLPQSKILLFADVLGVTPAELMGLKDLDSPFRVSDHERQVILAYRQHPAAQPFVDKLLELEPESIPQPKQA